MTDQRDTPDTRARTATHDETGREDLMGDGSGEPRGIRDDLAAFLDAAEARAAAATPGPWVTYAPVYDGHGTGFESGPSVWAAWADSDVAFERAEDAEFIAAARSDVPALVRMVRAVLALCDKPVMSDVVGIGYVHYVSVDGLRAALRGVTPPEANP